MFEECPLAWRMKYVDKMKEEPSRMLIAGSAAHAAVAEYVGRCHKAGLPSDAAIIDECIEAALVDRKPIGPSYRPDVRALLAKFAASYAVRLARPEIEQKLGFTAAEDVSKADLIDSIMKVERTNLQASDNTLRIR
jgi:hypothetical protein